MTKDVKARVAALRQELDRRGLYGFAVPRADEHQGEYVPARAERLAWIAGFSGSAGIALVLADRAALFVDGRYTLQAAAEVDASLFELKHLIEDPQTAWIEANLPKGAELGYDPWLHTVDWVERMRAACEKAGGRLTPCESNPLDAAWTDQPDAPLAAIAPHPMEYAGESSADKRARLGAELRRQGVAAAVLTQPDSIAWLLNVRGGDVPHTPLPLSFALLRDDGTVDWFVDRRKLSDGIERHIGNGVAIQPPGALTDAVDALGEAGARVGVDPSTAASWFFDRLRRAGAKVERMADPCVSPKARKNEAELAGMRAAHRRDGVAMVRFLRWLSEEAPKGELTELDVVARLLAFRQEQDLFADTSFDTIAGAGPNGAIVHYRAAPATNRRIEPDSLLLIDSGGQYRDGTTDITRTLAVGAPSPEMRRRFTLVLKGHIALARARFPKGTTGTQLDILAREALWADGLDYDHGTGHGVGSYLSVHEGPARISKAPSATPLEPGMILSNEPGFYKTGAYGIRIENLIAVRPCADLAHADRPFYEFETLTLAPIDLKLVDVALLRNDEAAWLDAYHQTVRDALTPLLDAETANWLARAAAPVAA